MKIEIKPAQETQLQEVMKDKRLTKPDSIIHCFFVGLQNEIVRIRNEGRK